jgi:hypothetical protein
MAAGVAVNRQQMAKDHSQVMELREEPGTLSEIFLLVLLNTAGASHMSLYNKHPNVWLLKLGEREDQMVRCATILMLYAEKISKRGLLVIVACHIMILIK